jgi:hypothetical protein
MRSCCRRLSSRQTAAYGFEFEADILCSLDGVTYGLADERRYFNAALFHV